MNGDTNLHCISCSRHWKTHVQELCNCAGQALDKRNATQSSGTPATKKKKWHRETRKFATFEKHELQIFQCDGRCPKRYNCKYASSQKTRAQFHEKCKRPIHKQNRSTDEPSKIMRRPCAQNALLEKSCIDNYKCRQIVTWQILKNPRCKQIPSACCLGARLFLGS